MSASSSAKADRIGADVEEEIISDYFAGLDISMVETQV
jgi:hypothetical protein